MDINIIIGLFVCILLIGACLLSLMQVIQLIIDNIKEFKEDKKIKAQKHSGSSTIYTYNTLKLWKI